MTQYVSTQFNGGLCDQPYIYAPDYEHPPIDVQLAHWMNLFSGINANGVISYANDMMLSSVSSEGWGVIPKRQFYQEHRSYIWDAANAVQTVEPKTTKREEKLEESLAIIESRFDGDLVCFPFQFGLRYVSLGLDSGVTHFADNEFGLGIEEIISLLVVFNKILDDEGQIVILAGGGFLSNMNIPGYKSCYTVHHCNTTGKKIVACTARSVSGNNTGVASGFVI